MVKMSNLTGAVEPTVLIIILVILLVLLYILVEKRRRKSIKRKFRDFSENYDLSREDMRAVPRITIPDSLEVVLTFTRGKGPDLKAYVVDMSLSGFCVKPLFPLKKLALYSIVANARMVTPVNAFVIKEMKTVRVERQVRKGLIAFYIQQIEGDQFEELKKFMAYLDKFLENEG